MIILPFLETIKERLEKIFFAETVLLEDALVGTKKLRVTDGDALLFNEEALWRTRQFSHLILYNDGAGDGSQIQGGRSGTEVAQVESVSVTNIFLKDPLTTTWTVGDGTKVARSFGPEGTRVRKIFLDDIRTSKDLPAICIIPQNMDLTWQFLSGTKDTINIDFMIYVKNDQSETASLQLYRLTDALHYVLMSRLHLPLSNAQYCFEKSSFASVKSVDIGAISTGSTFVKAARISWTADFYTIRSFITAQKAYVPFNQCHGS